MDKQALMEKIAKGAKGIHVSTMTESNIATISEVIETPALDLNRILSGNLYKGIPSRNMVGIVGKYGTFKSSFSALCMARSIEQGFQPVIIDTEGAQTTNFCQRWGLDPSKVIYISETFVEPVMAALAQLKESGQEKLFICIDSIGGLERYKAFTDALSNDPKLDQGQLQRNIKQLLKLLLNICIHQNSIAIVTGHLYAKPGAYITMDEIAGGEAMKHLPSILISLKKSALKDGKTVIGNEITATTLKNRMYPPFQESTVRIDYVKGIQPYVGLLTLAEKAGLVEKRGNTWWHINVNGPQSEVKLGVGEENVEGNLGEFPDLIDAINDWLKTTGYSTINEELKAASEFSADTSSVKIDQGDEGDEPEQKKKSKRKSLARRK